MDKRTGVRRPLGPARFPCFSFIVWIPSEITFLSRLAKFVTNHTYLKKDQIIDTKNASILHPFIVHSRLASAS